MLQVKLRMEIFFMTSGPGLKDEQIVYALVQK